MIRYNMPCMQSQLGVATTVYSIVRSTMASYIIGCHPTVDVFIKFFPAMFGV